MTPTRQSEIPAEPTGQLEIAAEPTGQPQSPALESKQSSLTGRMRTWLKVVMFGPNNAQSTEPKPASAEAAPMDQAAAEEWDRKKAEYKAKHPILDFIGI